MPCLRLRLSEIFLYLKAKTAKFPSCSRIYPPPPPQWKVSLVRTPHPSGISSKQNIPCLSPHCFKFCLLFHSKQLMPFAAAETYIHIIAELGKYHLLPWVISVPLLSTMALFSHFALQLGLVTLLITFDKVYKWTYKTH